MSLAPITPTSSLSPAPQASAELEVPFHLAAVVLLAGAVRQSELARTTRRSRLDLPMRPGVTLGACWAERMESLRIALNSRDLPLVIATNSIAGAPEGIAAWPRSLVRLDSEEPRGSGGAIRDIVAEFSPDDRVLVAPAHNYPRQHLAHVLNQLAASPGDVVIHTDQASTPTGFFLIRCGATADLPAKGFVDLKEQALPQIARRFDVRVLRAEHLPPLPIRTLDGYLQALRAASGAEASSGGLPVEEWRCTFALAEQGSEVHPTARLHDAIVLAGGRVERDAAVVRCLVGPGGVVKAGKAVFDELIGAGKEVP